MFAFLTKLVKRKEIPKASKLTTAAVEYRTLKLDSLNKVFSSDMSIIQISVCKNTIEAYSMFLKLLIDAFESEKQLGIAHVKDELKTIYIRDFFIDRNRNYLRPVTAMEAFSMHAAKFLDLYQDMENNLDPSFINQSNLRLTRGVATNLISLLETLKSI